MSSFVMPDSSAYACNSLSNSACALASLSEFVYEWMRGRVSVPVSGFVDKRSMSDRMSGRMTVCVGTCMTVSGREIDAKERKKGKNNSAESLRSPSE